MSKKDRSRGVQGKKKQDLRVARTRRRLGGALVALIHEKPFDEISVQELLARAGVGRSTFYLHYRDKDDLFISDVEEFLEYLSNFLTVHGEQSDRVLPVKELFAHIGGEARQFHAALAASGRLHDFYELARGQLARGIERRLKANSRTRVMKPSEYAAVSHAYAGAMLALLKWWVETGTKQSPEQMDRLFHDLVWGEKRR